MAAVCAVCRDEVDDRTRIVECGHDEFCYRCIVQWANNSNTCPLCQTRFVHLTRVQGTTRVPAVDRREENALRVMEELDSGEQSIDSEESWGSEGDYYDPDFVLPDHIVLFENNTMIDLRRQPDYRPNPFGRPPRNQPPSTITLPNGQQLYIDWDQPGGAAAPIGSSDDSSFEEQTNSTSETMEEEEEESSWSEE